ncbi:MAG TPA: sugar transferase [Terriglobales bacterium]|nr:sugar transferase [Terriglobales bacterium]
MRQAVTNERTASERSEQSSWYVRMIPGVPVLPAHWPPKKPPVSVHKEECAAATHLPEPRRKRGLAQFFVPHPIADAFPLYTAVAADLFLLLIVCGTQSLIIPGWALPVSSLPLFAVLVTLLAFSEGVYRNGAERPNQALILAVTRSVALAAILTYIRERGEVLALGLLGTVCCSSLALLGSRQLRFSLSTRCAEASASRNVLLVGGGPVARSIARTLTSDPLRRVCVRGSVDDDLPLSSTVLGRIADLDWLARAEFIDEIILALPGRPALARDAAEVALRNHLDIRAVPDLPPGHWPEAGVEFIGDVPVVTLHREPVPNAALCLKRAVDVAVAIIALILASPIMAMVALLIRLDSSGPILYRAERTGVKGRLFRCYKFRSMVVNADHLKGGLQARNQRQGPIFKIDDDPRITRVGRWIRRYSLDELPQLWNVLRGDMSMVGPRPHPAEEVRRYELHHYRRLDMKPGITGLWQITARHSPSFELNMHLDLTYIENWSLPLDLRLLLATVRVLFRPEGT